MPLPPRVAAEWQAGHGGYDPAGNRWVRGWLWLTVPAVRLLARGRVSPHLVTVSGVVLAAAAAGAAAAGGAFRLMAAVAALASAFADTADGLLAVWSHRVTVAGSVLDGVADRCAEAAFAVALGLAGCPWALAAAAAAAGYLLEYARARVGEVVLLTVAERPVRVLATAVGVLAAPLAGSAAALLLGLTLVGCGQLAVRLRGR